MILLLDVSNFISPFYEFIANAIKVSSSLLATGSELSMKLSNLASSCPYATRI